MDTLSQIGLDKEKSAQLAEGLNDLLANYSVFYQNTRGYHWHIKGEKFFELHVKFEELYNDLFEKIDEIAERILTLGHAPSYKFSEYLYAAEVKESNQASNGIDCVKQIVDTFGVLIGKQRALLSLAADMDDEGTNAQMSDYIREQEKLVWMYTAFLNQ